MRAYRRGHTLIECLVVIALLGVTLATVTLTLHALYQADRRVRDELAYESALERLAAQLRFDTHQALSATVDRQADKTAPGAGLSLSFPAGRTVQYSLGSQRIERVVRRGETIEHRETYRLPLASSAAWHVREDRVPPLVSLVLERRVGAEPGRPAVTQACRFDAALRVVAPRAIGRPKT